MTSKISKKFICLTSALLCSACAFEPAFRAPLAAQPDTRASRNFTSFSGALRCMDDMLVNAGKPRVILSSTDIPDRTKKIAVGADDMLVNAIGHMNRRSRTYVFQDQGLVRDGGLIDFRITPKKNVPRPDYYIRGSISQLDSNAMRDDAGLDLEREGSNGAGLLNGGFSRGRTVSVVSVDLHLVKFPSRQVVPGLSVSNSMAVVFARFRGRGQWLGQFDRDQPVAAGGSHRKPQSSGQELDRTRSDRAFGPAQRLALLAMFVTCGDIHPAARGSGTPIHV